MRKEKIQSKDFEIGDIVQFELEELKNNTGTIVKVETIEDFKKYHIENSTTKKIVRRQECQMRHRIPDGKLQFFRDPVLAQERLKQRENNLSEIIKNNLNENIENNNSKSIIIEHEIENPHKYVALRGAIVSRFVHNRV